MEDLKSSFLQNIF